MQEGGSCVESRHLSALYGVLKHARADHHCAQLPRFLSFFQCRNEVSMWLDAMTRRARIACCAVAGGPHYTHSIGTSNHGRSSSLVDGWPFIRLRRGYAIDPSEKGKPSTRLQVECPSSSNARNLRCGSAGAQMRRSLELVWSVAGLAETLV